MEEKLAQYRAQRAKDYEAKKQAGEVNFATKGWQYLQTWGNKNTAAAATNKSPDTDQSNLQTQSKEPLIFDSSGTVGDTQRLEFNRNIIYHPTFWKGVLWCVLWALFIELGFGAVYFVVSVSVILYRTMRPGSRSSTEPSAYSVFNPNCERLDGTFTAEQFEKELRFGAGSVH